MDLVTRVRRAPALAVRIAIDQVRTVGAALRIRSAELAGHARPSLVRAAEQRVAALRGEEARTTTPLVVQAEAVETARLDWERARDGRPPSRIVEAVGRGHWVGRRR